MGNELSKEEKHEQKILQAPNVGKASDLYWASRAGDVDTVRKILDNTSFNDLNRLEPNGSTALHAASFFGHADVVRILLENRGVMRHRKNRHGLTAYQEAANAEIRQLFHRPDNGRFCNHSTDSNKNIFHFHSEQASEDDAVAPDDWVQGVDSDSHVRLQRMAMKVLKVTSSSPLLRSIISRVRESKHDQEDGNNIGSPELNRLRNCIDEYLTPNHRQYARACDLLSEYAKTDKAEHLLRLYTLETPFCYRLGTTAGAQDLSVLLYMRLKSLKARAFQGRTYRGLSMTKTDFNAYEWALKRKGSLLSIKSFCSSSVDEMVARRFMWTSSGEKLNVLMVLEFPRRCDTAIQLYAISDELPCISYFENEREVLLIPNTMFHVVNIKHENANNQYTIHLENVLPEVDFTVLYSSLCESWG